MQKFIITIDGEMRFGDVRLHKELIPYGGDDCYGGGSWSLSHDGSEIELFGASYDFGPACFDRLKSIDWTGIDCRSHPLRYYPYYPAKHDSMPILPSME